MDSSDPPPLPLHTTSSPPMFNTPFEGIPIGLQPSTSDAASTTTLATTTASSPADDDNGSSLRTTPEVVKGTSSLKKLHNALESQVSKQIEVEAAEVDDQPTGTVIATKGQKAISTTRRCSQRIKHNVLTTTTTTTATTTTTTTTTAAIAGKKSAAVAPTPPATPAQTNPSLSPRSETPAEDDDLPSKTRALRSTAKKPVIKEPKSAKELPRRASTRVSALNAIAAMTTAATPKTQSVKRARSSETADTEAADAKTGGARKKAKGETQAEEEESSVKSTSKKPSKAMSVTPADEEPELPSKRKKVWMNQGLYVGQEDDGASLNLRPASKKGKGKKQRPNSLPLPMFRGKDIMEKKRDFKLPYAVFAPSGSKCPAPPVWRKLSHNQLIGDAKYIWKREGASTVKCVCTEDCSESCLNRCTWVECTDLNCDLGRNCSNRSFADLMDRVKSAKEFGIGVEVSQTGNRGYGLRALRSFQPGQIIVEYSGEIITQEESERRLDEVYNNNTNYYLMLFDQNMILDATRGSVARFVNHSCDPNCTMEKWVVGGQPRMALFAGDKGIDAGDELTYDYNFTWFKGVTQCPCKCGSDNCRGVLGKRSDRLGITPPQKTKPRKKRKLSAKEKPLVPVAQPTKKERKPPFPRRPPTPPPTKEPEPEIVIPSDSEDDSEASDDVYETPVKKTTGTPVIRSTRTRSRIIRTYKVNKTIAKPSTPRSVTSESAVAAAVEEALAEASAAKENGKTTRRLTIGITESVTAAISDSEGQPLAQVKGTFIESMDVAADVAIEA